MNRRLPLTFALVAFACCAALANANGGGGGGHAAAPAPSGGGHAAAPAPSGGGHAHAPASSGGGGSRGSAPRSSYGSNGSNGSRRASVGGTSGPSLGASRQGGPAPGGAGIASSGGGAYYGDGGYGCGNGGPCVDNGYGGEGGDLYIINFYFLPGFRPQPAAEQPYGNTVGYEEHLLTGQHPVGGGGGGERLAVPKGAVVVLDPGTTAYGNPGHRQQSDFPIQSRMTDLAVRYAIVMRDGTAFASTDMPKWSGPMIVGKDRTGKLFSVKGSTVNLLASRIPPQPDIP